MPKQIKLIIASKEHCPELAMYNKQLVDCGGSNNTMSLLELEERMIAFMNSGYKAVIFDYNGTHIGYTLINIKKTPVFIRHFFIVEEYRHLGFGTEAFKQTLEFLKVDRVDLSVLVSNNIGLSFWRHCGLVPYEIHMCYKKK